MLSAPLNLGQVDAGRIFDYLYGFFYRDFVEHETYLAEQILIDAESHKRMDGKELTFWHLTSRKQKYNFKNKSTGRYEVVEERLPDFARSQRIEWVKQIIENHDNPSILCFYHQESDGKKPIRFYMWAHQHDFVVILQKLGGSTSILVTSFYINVQSKRAEYQARYNRYTSGQAGELIGCEWF